MARTLLACVSLVACTIWGLGSARADNETVLLTVPQTPEPALVELFHRVEAELRLHQFRPEVLVAPLGDSTESLLGAQASAQRAFAAIAIVEQAQSAMLHVWIVDARTGLTRQYRVTQQGGEEPVNVVAVRAIDLLRANRAAAQAPPSAAGENVPSGRASTATTPPRAASGRAPSDGSATTPGGATSSRASAAASGAQPVQPSKPAPPSAAAEARAKPDSQTASEPRAPARAEQRDAAAVREPPRAPAQAEQRDAAAVRDESSSSESVEIADTSAPETYRYKPTLLQFATEVVALSLSRRMGWSFGPSIGAWLTLGDRLRLGVIGVAPLWGATLHAPLGDPAIWQELLWIEVGVVLARAGPLQLSAAGGGGLHWLQARGRAAKPYRSNNASTWSWTASLGARADVMLSEHWSLGMTLRARVFLPPVEVAVETESARLATPAMEGALGIALWL